MTYPVHYVPAGDVLPIFFSTFDGGTGASLTMTGLAVTDIEIYKDGSVTQRSSDAGYTLLDTDGIDFDSLTGIHGFSIDTGDNTDANFYTVGAWFHVVVSAVTVDAQTVSFVAAAFRIMAAEAIAGKPKADVDAWLGTAAATPSVAGVPEVDLTHVAGATTNVSALATNVDAILTDTGTTLDTLIKDIPTVAEFEARTLVSAGYASPTNITAATGVSLAATTGLGNQTANITGNLSGSVGSVTGAVGSVTGLTAADVGAIKTKTDSLNFTTAGIVDANIQQINDVTITGNGGTGTEFGV